MGAFMGLTDSTTIPEDKVKDFIDDFLTLADAGGMMDYTEVKLYNKSIYLIKPLADTDEEYISFNYNYFENDFWEYAGFNKKHRNIYSNKLGYFQFNRVMHALYTLELIYSGSNTRIYGDVVNCPKTSVAWIYNVLNKNYQGLPRFSDPIYIYNNVFHNEADTFEDIFQEIPGIYDRDRTIMDFIEYIFLNNETKKAIDFFLSKIKNVDDTLHKGFALLLLKVIDDGCKKLLDSKMSHAEIFEGIKKRLEYGIDRIKNDASAHYENTESLFSFFTAFAYDKFNGIIARKYMQDVLGFSDDETETIMRLIEDFKKYRKDDYDIFVDKKKFYYMPTQSYFCKDDSDRLAYWWKYDDKIVLSDHYYETMSKLKEKFDSFVENEPPVQNSAEATKELMSVCHRMYKKLPNVFLFESLFYEILGHITEKKYFAVIKLLDYYTCICSQKFSEEEKTDHIFLKTFSESIWDMKILIATLSNLKLRKKVFCF